MNAVESIEQAEQLRRRGDEAGALDAFARAAALARDVFDPATEARGMLGVGQMRVLLDDSRGACEAFEEAVARAVEGGLPDVEADAWLGFAGAAFDGGKSKDGHDALLEAMALSRTLADEAPDDRARKERLARTIRIYGEHLGVLGSDADAKQALELARIMYSDLGDQEFARGIQEEIQKLRDWAR